MTKYIHISTNLLTQRRIRSDHQCISILAQTKLARKRARDRDFQRQLRSRRKNYITWLENEVQKLKREQSNNGLIQHLHQRNAALQAELTRIKMALGMECTHSTSLPNTTNSIATNLPFYEVPASQHIPQYPNYSTEVAQNSFPFSFPLSHDFRSNQWLSQSLAFRQDSVLSLPTTFPLTTTNYSSNRPQLYTEGYAAFNGSNSEPTNSDCLSTSQY